MVVRFLLYSACLLLSACLSGSDSSQSKSPISYDITSLGSQRYQVAFQANISGEHNGYWQFGDGYVSAGRSVNHIYYSPGQYTITYSYQQNGQEYTLSDTLVLEGATQNLDVISRELITIDSDHNDPNQAWLSNDHNPQSVTAPSKVSGIMMAQGSCQTGRLCKLGDDIDRYRLHSEAPFILEIESYEGDLIIQVDNHTNELRRIELDAGEHTIELRRASERVRYTMSLTINSTAVPQSYQPGKLIVQYHDKTQPELLDISDPRLRSYANIQQARTALQQNENIKTVNYNYWRFSNSEYQWSLNEFGIPLLWQWLPNKGEKVRVAVIDTGLFQHSELAQLQIQDSYDFVSDPLQSDDGDGWDANPFDASASGHGTHVTGIIASQGQLNTSGIAGISPNVEIMPIRSIGRFGATSYDLIQSLLYAAGLENDSGHRPSRPADIINLSLGGENYSQLERDIIAQVSDLGVILVAASGNQGSTQIEYPAAYPNVIAVGAHDRFGDITSYSNTGRSLDVIAPGGSCDDAQCTNGIVNLSEHGYKKMSGTSMATAHVTAMLANLKSHRMDIDTHDIQKLIESGQLTNQAQHNPNTGWGNLDANKLGNLVSSSTPAVTRIWIPRQIMYQHTDQILRIPMIRRGDQSIDNLNLQVIPTNLTYDINEISSQMYELKVENPQDIEEMSLRYFNGESWQTIKTKLIDQSVGYHVDFLNHLYVQLNSQRTPLRAALKQTKWHLQLPQTELNQTIQVSSDIDYDGIYCETGEFCGQHYQCQPNLARTLDQCDSGKAFASPLTGQLIDQN